MTKEDIRLLFAYDRWANGRRLAAVSMLSHGQFTRDMGNAYGEWATRIDRLGGLTKQ